MNYLQGFWIRLFWDVIIKLVVNERRPSLKAPINGWSFKRAAVLLWSGFWLSFLHAAPSSIVYADPIEPVSASITLLKPIQMPSVSSQEPLQTVFISKLRDYGTYPNNFAPNNCTSYVASRLPVAWTGNANQWAAAAAALGYKVSAVPDAGTIAANSTDSYLGHVAIVGEVKDGLVRLEEQNYAGPGVITTNRWAPISQYVYIYV